VKLRWIVYVLLAFAALGAVLVAVGAAPTPATDQSSSVGVKARSAGPRRGLTPAVSTGSCPYRRLIGCAR